MQENTDPERDRHTSGAGDIARLQRFKLAQDPVYGDVLSELRRGDKRSHWMWFIFPQIAGLGHSSTARFFAIDHAAEAQAYLADPTLGLRLRECTNIVLNWRDRKTAQDILGPIDALKFHSSMTLFEAVCGDCTFSEALDAFYAGERDKRTLDILESVKAQKSAP